MGISAASIGNTDVLTIATGTPPRHSAGNRRARRCRTISNRLRTTSHELTFDTQAGEALASRKAAIKKHSIITDGGTYIFSRPAVLCLAAEAVVWYSKLPHLHLNGCDDDN